MYINSKIINPGDININLSTFKKIPNVYSKSINRNHFFACLKKLIASKVFHNNTCFLTITYKEKGKYKKCSRCGQIKLAHNKYFSKNKTSKDGFYSIFFVLLQKTPDIRGACPKRTRPSCFSSFTLNLLTDRLFVNCLKYLADKFGTHTQGVGKQSACRE